MTDSSRTATEQLLISNAIDQTVSKLDFRVLAGKTVYFDPQYLDGTVDKGYLVSTLRQHLLASGCLLQEERAKATYVVEARSGGVGTDNNSLLIGVPQMNLPTVIPGQPSSIPEIPLAKKTNQMGAAKIAVFAFNRTTGERVWQSGVLEARSDSRDLWLFGAGPFQNGSIRKGTTFAGGDLPQVPLMPFGETAVAEEPRPAPGLTPVTDNSTFTERQPARVTPVGAKVETPRPLPASVKENEPKK
jgi:hypothetical protein